MALVFIGLGSNLGDGRKNVLEAWRQLGQTAGLVTLALSAPYRSEPIGMESRQWFTNAVGVLHTGLPPTALMTLLLATEAKMGRDRSRGSDRSIDLDILYYDDLVLDSPELVVPHSEISRRLFVLAPLEELAPEHVHPVTKLTTRAMRISLAAESRQSIEKTEWSGLASSLVGVRRGSF